MRLPGFPVAIAPASPLTVAGAVTELAPIGSSTPCSLFGRAPVWRRGAEPYVCASPRAGRQLRPDAGSDKTDMGRRQLSFNRIRATSPAMNPRKVYLASVCAAFLAASAAVSGQAAAAQTTANSNVELASSAYKALSAGDPATAIASYTSAIESRQLEPEVLANALLNRGLAYQRLNQHDLAVADYTAALRIDAMSAKLRAMALYNRGLSFQRLEQPSRAIEDFTSALFLDQEFSYAFYSRGMVLRDTGQYLFALADFEKALQFKYPDAARVYFGEALAFDSLKRPADARQALTQALAANPQFEPARARLAALDGKVSAQPISGASDQMETASIAGAAPSLPKAEAPSVAQAEDATVEAARPRTSKAIVDRIPADGTETKAANAAQMQMAGAAPSDGGSDKMVAIEPVSDTPDQPADAGGDSQTQVASVASDSAPAAAEATPVAEGWAVQVASASSEDGAWTTFKNIQSRHPVLADKKPIVLKADLGSKGIFFRVRFTGYDTQADAKSACSKLKSVGVNCFVSKAAS